AIIYRSNSKLITNARSERIEVPYTIKLETDSSNRFVSCYSEISDIGSEVTRRACESIGGQFNNERCLLSPDIQNTQDDYRLLSYQNFKENIYQSFFRDNFVYRMEGGDTVEGNINMTNNASLTVEEVSGPMDVINKDFAD